MTSDQITSALDKIFHQDGRRIVFWNDEAREFGDFITGLSIDGVNVLLIDDWAALEVKKRIELDDSMGRYLLYSAKVAPAMEEDWYLDIRHYGHTFTADRLSILIDELGLMNHSLRSHLAQRRKFFESKERTKKLLHLILPTDMESELDRKMVAVLLKAEQADLFSFLRVLFQEMAEEDGLDMVLPTAGWSQVEKMELADFFWESVRGLRLCGRKAHAQKSAPAPPGHRFLWHPRGDASAFPHSPSLARRWTPKCLGVSFAMARQQQHRSLLRCLVRKSREAREDRRSAPRLLDRGTG